jgi:ribose 5-phosphate isomerase B
MPQQCHRGTVRIAFGADDETAVTAGVRQHLAARGHEVMVIAAGEEWPEVGRAVGSAIASGAADVGVVCCWTGTGVSIAANKIVGVRAALCTDAETARGARRWNDANVLALGLRLTTEALAGEIIDAFLDGSADASEGPAVARVEPGPAQR